ncbi:hypothetical protein, partial [Sporosarcina sp. P31]
GLLRFFQAYVISGMGLWFLHVHFLFPVCSVVCGLAVYVSGESIVPTTALVDGFREEPETGKFACLCLLATPTTAGAFVGLWVGQFG